jgi:hypothetical protein
MEEIFKKTYIEERCKKLSSKNKMYVLAVIQALTFAEKTQKEMAVENEKQTTIQPKFEAGNERA